MENNIKYEVVPMCRRRSYTHPPAEKTFPSNKFKERDKHHDSCCVDFMCKYSRKNDLNKSFTRIKSTMSNESSSSSSAVRNNISLTDRPLEPQAEKCRLKHSRKFRDQQRQQSVILQVMCCRNRRGSSGSTGPYTSASPAEYSKLSQSSSLGSTYCSSVHTDSSGLSSSLSTSMLSQDSGYGEPSCYLRIVYPEHICVNNKKCTNKNKASLNIHLQNLSSKMPKSFCESEALPHEFALCSGVKRDGYLSKRRHAICETSDEMKLNFHDALSSFLTIKAMIKYEFL